MNPLVRALIDREEKRQQNTLSLIPSENYVSAAVREAESSVFTNKYAEGYPGKRYYGGTEVCDELELLCQQQAQAVFQTDYFVNVQAYSGSPANLAIYLALLEPGDTIMGLDLAAGGHLTHGAKVSVSGKLFHSVTYTVDETTHTINYDTLQDLATEHKPKIIIAGTTAYSRTLDFARFAQIAKSVDAYLIADVSHISGLVATGLHPTPFGYADVIMTTTHKMLRGPRGALIFSQTEQIANKINRAIFPSIQGGPHMHTIAAITQCLFEAQESSYTTYCEQILKNTQAMVETFQKRDFTVITGGTDNHLWLLDLRSKNITGADAQEKLEAHEIIVNKNSIPFDPAGAFTPSGIRLGTPAITTRGITETASAILAGFMCDILESKTFFEEELKQLISRHPLP